MDDGSDLTGIRIEAKGTKGKWTKGKRKKGNRNPVRKWETENRETML